jgi:hypothetical protein
MAVTDLTDSLPWWTRQGAGPTGGPGAAPMGAGGQPGGVGGQPPPGVSPQAWMAYLTQMFNPASASGANPADMPSPDASPMAVHVLGDADHGTGDNPPVTPFALPPVAQPGPMTGPAGPVSNLPAPQRPPPPGPMTGPAGPIANLPHPQAPQPPQSPTPWFTPSNTPMPWQGPNPNAPAPDAQPAGPAPVPGPLATGGAGGQGATSNPRFVQVDRPNAPAAGGPQGRGGPPQMTALNLAGLFGRGQPAVNPDAPAANAQPVSGVLNGALSKAPWSMGPLQKGSVWPRDMGPFTPGQTAARGLKQRYG